MKNYINIFTYEYPEKPEKNFAQLVTGTTSLFCAIADLPFDEGTRKLEELARVYGKEIEVRKHDEYIVTEVIAFIE